jgi:hypothetical protein
MRITYSECVSGALFIQYAVRMRRVVLSPVACPAVQYFTPYPITGTTFGGGGMLNTK